MGRILNKPNSENDGNLVILADTQAPVTLRSPSGQIIETGDNKGESNGYGGTFRFSRPGQAYPQGTTIQIGNSVYDVGNIGLRDENPKLISGTGNELNYTASGGGGGGGSASMLNLAPFNKALGLGSGVSAAYSAVPGQEREFREANDRLFNKWSDMYDPAIQEFLGDLDRSRLSYLQGKGAADVAQGLSMPTGMDMSSGLGLAALMGRGTAFGQGQGMVASDALTRDELERIGRNLDALEIGKKMEGHTNDGLAGLARIASQGALSLADNETAAQLQKTAHDAKLQIAGMENAADRKMGSFNSDLGYWNIVKPAVDEGIDWVFDRFRQ